MSNPSMANQLRTSELQTWWQRNLGRWLREAPLVAANPQSNPFRFECLVGDGSQRTFYRAHRQSPAGTTNSKKSFIVLSDPGWHLSKDYAPHQAYLLQAGIPVPQFYYEDVQAGFLVMEDLGDQLLQLQIEAKPAEREQWLQSAVSTLALLHRRTYPVPLSLPVATRSFDAQKYSEEFLFTALHLLQNWLGLPALTENSRQEISRFSTTLAATGPQVFCHRDYHCRNLLVYDEKLFLIDFQDARLGPPHYDLASLLYDAYVPLDEPFRQSLLDLYFDGLRGCALEAAIEPKTFSQELKAVAFQRVIKAAGSFASFFTRYGKSSHLAYLLPALTSAEALQKAEVSLPRADGFFAVGQWLQLTREKLEGEKP